MSDGAGWDDLDQGVLFEVGDLLEAELTETFALYQELFSEWEEFLSVLEARGLKEAWVQEKQTPGGLHGQE